MRLTEQVILGLLLVLIGALGFITVYSVHSWLRPRANDASADASPATIPGICWFHTWGPWGQDIWDNGSPRRTTGSYGSCLMFSRRCVRCGLGQTRFRIESNAATGMNDGKARGK